MAAKYCERKSGPAISEGEHSLCKIVLQGFAFDSDIRIYFMPWQAKMCNIKSLKNSQFNMPSIGNNL